MSEKIVITLEQNVAIKSLSDGMRDSVITRHIQGWTRLENVCLNNLTTDQMARILYEPNSYEVEQTPFELGDWVTRLENDSKLSNRKVGRVFKIGSILGNTKYDSDGIAHLDKYIRHATKEEIIWAELGREVGEFVDNDIVFGHDGSVYEIDRKLPGRTSKDMYERGELKGFYPASSFIKFP